MLERLFDNKIERIFSKLIEKYNNTITPDLKKTIKIILSEDDIQNKNILISQTKEIYKLTDEQLNEYMMIIQLEILYESVVNDFNAILELISENNILCTEMAEEIHELEKVKNSFLNTLAEISKFTEQNAPQEEYSKETSKYDELTSVENFLLFLSDIENDRKINVNSRSGKEKSSIIKFLKELTILMYSNFEVLRNKGMLHQINKPSGGGIVFTEANIAYERIGTATSKVSYIRVPICKENIEILSKKYNNYNWRYVMLIIGFGDFKNEGINEIKLYDRFRKKISIHIEEIENIIRIFNTPFTEETFLLATNMIEQGLDNIKSLTENPLKSLSFVEMPKFHK